MYQVTEARDGAEGIEKAQEIVPDLIISDVMMPKKDGYEVCRTLKRDEKTSHIPIILLTAKAASENKIEGLETRGGRLPHQAVRAEGASREGQKPHRTETEAERAIQSLHATKPGEIAVTSMDDAFLSRIQGIVEKRMADEEFSVGGLAAEAGMSRVQLHRKLTALTNQSASDFIRYMRLHRAMDLLKNHAGTVSEIAYRVGFSDPSHFSKSFHKQFGVPPSVLSHK